MTSQRRRKSPWKETCAQTQELTASFQQEPTLWILKPRQLSPQ
jgi:hypothetical protein